MTTIRWSLLNLGIKDIRYYYYNEEINQATEVLLHGDTFKLPANIKNKQENAQPGV